VMADQIHTVRRRLSSIARHVVLTGAPAPAPVADAGSQSWPSMVGTVLLRRTYLATTAQFWANLYRYCCGCCSRIVFTEADTSEGPQQAEASDRVDAVAPEQPQRAYGRLLHARLGLGWRLARARGRDRVNV
jgi:hypothetical protein